MKHKRPSFGIVLTNNFEAMALEKLNQLLHEHCVYATRSVYRHHPHPHCTQIITSSFHQF